jgi:tetratricopeptide (TPR) repeat protein
MKQNPETPLYEVDLGVILEKKGSTKASDKQFNQIIKFYKESISGTNAAGNAFIKVDKADWAEKMYLEGRKFSKKPYIHCQALAELYSRQNKTDEMIREYINLAIENDQNITLVQNSLQDELKDEAQLEKLERVLLTQVQENPSQRVYIDLLLWLYVQQKNFKQAFLQAKAIDKRFKLRGQGILDVGFIAYENKDYLAAQKIFEHLIKEYPEGNTYPSARRYLILSKEEIIKTTFPIDKQRVREVIKDYNGMIADLGKNSNTLDAMQNVAMLYGFYLDSKDTATVLLNEAIEFGKFDPRFTAKCKIALGDITLLKGEPWDASLLYSQAEKLQKDAPIGYDAKLKNAKLSYYKGEFELAQAHLDILKTATTREIANDAMDLSLLIQNNTLTDEDTLSRAMREYARIDQLLFQNKNSEALISLDKMLKDYPKHSLTDEIYWQQSKIFTKEGKNEKVLEMYQKILLEHSTDVLGDDAFFYSAKLYEEKLNNKPKAMEMYKEMLTKYSGSLYVADARKRFRALRGDSQ